MKNYVAWLPDIMPRHQIEFGSKAANLGLIARKSRTPQGFCLSTHAYNEAIECSGKLQQIVAIAEEAQDKSLGVLEDASQKITSLFSELTIPEHVIEVLYAYYHQLIGDRDSIKVAVRSSATAEDLPTASFAGQLESYLNIESFGEVKKAVVECWASLWSARAIHYRHQKNIGQKNTGMAVIVQEMVDASLSGVMFTANPLTNNRNEIYIEAIQGLGEALVQGEKSGDRYTISKNDFFIVKKDTVGKEALLVDFNIKWLAREGAKLQYLFYDENQDIEWAMDKGEIYLLQTRPITTLGDEEPQELDSKKMTNIQKDIWTNVNERFPDPILPIDSVIAKMFYLSLFSAYQELGYKVPVVDWSRVEEGEFPDFFQPPAIKLGLRRIFSLFKFLNEDIAESWRYNEKAFNKYLDFLKDDLIKDFPMEIIIEYLDDALKDFQRANTFRYFLYIQYGTWYKILGATLGLLFGEQGRKIQQDLIAGHPQLTMEVNEELVRLAKKAKNSPNVTELILETDTSNIAARLQERAEGKDFLAQFAAFMDSYGDREISQGLGGIAAATWRDDPRVVWGMLRGLLLAKEEHIHATSTILKRREEAERKLDSLMKQGFARILPLKGLLAKLLNYARKYTAFREDSHFYLTQAMPIFRAMFLELGKKLVKRQVIENPDDVMYFTYWELKTLVFEIYNHKKISKLDIAEKLQQRKARLERRRKKWANRNLTVNTLSKHLLKGVGASHGKISGKCRVVVDAKDLALLQPGEILVAQSTNPSWTPVFSFVGGLIVEYGSALSHAAIIAREYGIPAVMGVPGVTKILKDGDMVTIDGSAGLIDLQQK